MNYFKARQRKDGGRWDYTCFNRSIGILPVGYCTGATYGGDEVGDEAGGDKLKYHSDGHATQAEAEGCWVDYLVDNATFRDGLHVPHYTHRCEAPGCTTLTSGTCRVREGRRCIFLCDAHRNKETLRGIISKITESWES